MEATEPLKSNKLTAVDRCDSCGAQAFVYAELSSGYLLFCSHHWNRYQESIQDSLRDFFDETYKLIPTKDKYEDEEVE